MEATKVLFEDKVSESWSAYTDHNPVEVGLAKGWLYRPPPRTPRKLRRPKWSLFRGSGERAQVGGAALATELDRRVGDEQPTTWPELVTLGVGVARAVLGEEPKRMFVPGFGVVSLSFLSMTKRFLELRFVSDRRRHGRSGRNRWRR